MLEPRGLYRTDVKRPDGVPMIPWEMGKLLVWDVTVVDALAPSRLNQGSLFNPGTTAGGCKKVEFFWSKGQRSNLLIELQGSNGMRSNFIVFVVWLGRFAPFAK